MQLFQLEHMGKRRLAMLRNLLESQFPQIDATALAASSEVLSDWSDGYHHDSMYGFLRAAEQLRRKEIPDISLQIGDRAQLTDSGLLGYAVLTAPTVGHAAKLTSHALNSSQYLVRTKQSPKDGLNRVVFNIVNDARPYREALLEMSVLAVWRCTQSILIDGRAATPSFVTFNYPEPPHGNKYRELFSCPVMFDEAHTVLAYPEEWSKEAIPSGNSEMLRICSSEMKQVLGEGYRGNNLVARVKRALVEHPKECNYSLESTAELLNLSSRNLRRQLAQANTGFRDICLGVRMELAQQYLQSTNMPLKAIAFQLGYRHANNFHRAYTDYYSESPTLTREKHLTRIGVERSL
ncbi:AraC family transcriptional regulator ligand-binding domain-containing protein [Spongiibacter sp. KMU-158]|uniref:AraC family transcriptional regulator ligand-binding domain-containing protein n=1 Tax=Spongiibacter pelagi TaxID=2760804 RepID=A0A927GW97_9GAMM|nr:AraC family transcriptional regulator [Spongiibacter pelagi]MBD2858903.1 AraC family transcriptional regulator ligand-binding domain-containing protein [Spongiibacter pelagi]